MSTMKKIWSALLVDRRAITALEYAMIAGIVGAIVATGFGTMGGDLSAFYTNVGTSL